MEDSGSMPGDFGLVYPPWNFVGGGADWLERVAGEVGLDHLTVPVVTGEQTQFRLCGAFESPFFHTEGGWHFPPQSKLYAASGVRPRTARWFGSRDVLTGIRAQADKLNLSLLLGVDLPRIGAISDQSPSLRGRSAWGDELVSFSPCICNPDFRELVQATLADLACREPAGLVLHNISLEPMQYTSSGRGRLEQLAQLGEFSGMCFCAACRQIARMAGLDPDAVAELVRAHAVRLARSSAAELVRGCERVTGQPLEAYRAARLADCRKWLDRLGAAHATRRFLVVDEFLSNAERQTPKELLGTRWASIGAARWYLLPILLRRCSSKKCSSKDELNFDQIPGFSAHKGLLLGVWNPNGPGADGLVRIVSHAASTGMDFFDFEGLEEAPGGVVTWLKQAVRYARRG